MRPPAQMTQIAGSLLVALAIAAVAIAVVTAHFGPTSTARLEAREDAIDAREERAKEREEAEERREEESGGNSGPG